jgi:hypothetical protein
MAELHLLRYPKKSHCKMVRLPGPSVELAEFFGIMMGDGGINNNWQANIALNSDKDSDYVQYVRQLVVHLFGIAPRIMQRKNEKVVIVSLASTTLVDYLVANGLCRGNKIRQGLQIPSWILRSTDFTKACVRGLIDTDGCLYIHRHSVRGRTYQNIGLCFSTHAPQLMLQMQALFVEFGLIPHISNRGRNLRLYKAQAIERYLELVGTNNKRIRQVYESWKRG